MKCPACNGDTFVRETRNPIRRRQCSDCGHRFQTIEQIYNGGHAAVEQKERKERKPKPVTVPTIAAVKSTAKKRAEARRKIEDRNIEREYKSFNDNWYEEDSNFLPNTW
jgi:transcriptional regulator NrdR family protein